MMIIRQKTKGVTLLEVLLVLAIASSLLVLLLNYTIQKADELRRDKTVLQVQQILNAGMSFYVSNSFWPLKNATINTTQCGTWSDLSKLKPPNANYIPSNFNINSYGKTFSITCDNSLPNGGGFFVVTQADTATNAAIIAGRLPMAVRTNSIAAFPVSACTSSDCTYVVANVSIPGQNLNNARSVNFAATYYSGSCVPAPKCPPNMKPNILVFPGSVMGVTNGASSFQCINGDYNIPGPTPCTFKTNSLSSFSAFARGDTNGNPVDPNAASGGPPMSCANAPISPVQRCEKTSYPSPTYFNSDGTKYWRVCLGVTTDQGQVTPSHYLQGMAMGKVVAITRCVPNDGNEQPSGSVDVYQ